jgi:hypothetical protein
MMQINGIFYQVQFHRHDPLPVFGLFLEVRQLNNLQNMAFSRRDKNQSLRSNPAKFIVGESTEHDMEFSASSK